MMADPNARTTEPDNLVDLRSRAASRLNGPAAAKGSAARAVDALAVLHALASAPATAAEALTLLHELQVHQVELDLQAQELRETRAELESALRRQLDIYDGQPVGCFTIDSRRVLHEVNQTGAAMLGVRREDAAGLLLDAFFSAESGRRFASLVAPLEPGSKGRPCILSLSPKAGPVQRVLVSTVADPAGAFCHVSMADPADALQGPPEPS